MRACVRTCVTASESPRLRHDVSSTGRGRCAVQEVGGVMGEGRKRRGWKKMEGGGVEKEKWGSGSEETWGNGEGEKG